MKNGCSDTRSRGDLVCSLFPHPEQRIKTRNTKMEGSLFRVFNCFQIMRFWLESSFWDSKSLVYSANWLLLEPSCNKSKVNITFLVIHVQFRKLFHVGNYGWWVAGRLMSSVFLTFLYVIYSLSYCPGEKKNFKIMVILWDL